MLTFLESFLRLEVRHYPLLTLEAKKFMQFRIVVQLPLQFSHFLTVHEQIVLALQFESFQLRLSLLPDVKRYCNQGSTAALLEH